MAFLRDRPDRQRKANRQWKDQADSHYDNHDIAKALRSLLGKVSGIIVTRNEIKDRKIIRGGSVVCEPTCDVR
ncbi:MAG: hypothetical protein E5V33_22420 [Mesorhizobium sp.]|uniref:hypothetical protein n=1 Tax=Mesorhizobium sp. TaxID=1871066 RepID=UPI00121CF8A8|nr:hypothetical protein [Mesorhizobium sp.]TIT73178.1 MAG: hypothetical protein E5W60_02840 [Mesorhizobium sp.]TIX10791.1 MAG: hypothetical protein E5V44_08910 [Mesorhizobium sp.]TIX56935.1 MAG: hypothetical protein E5V33_22420 [Mesorhizobium sp.]